MTEDDDDDLTLQVSDGELRHAEPCATPRHHL
jgi:hypothetical protein